MEKILEAYKSIAEHLPRIDRLQAAFGEDENFKTVLGFIFKDLAEFHQRVYRFFRRRGWAILFAFDWGLFERRFRSLLSSMSFRFELVDKEAAAIHFGDMKKARDIDLREYEKEEQQRQFSMLQAAYSWLSAAEDAQEEYLEELANKRQPGTCNWVLEQDTVKAWVEPTGIEPLIWLTGKPGGGKSVLASFLVHHLQPRKDSTVLYFFCALNSTRTTCAEVLRTMAFQALQQNPQLASLVHQEYLQKVSTRSTPKMKALLKDIFAVAKYVHLVIDGIDECEPTTQQEILKSVSELQRNASDIIKILISSRREPQISEALTTKAHISLNGRTDGAIGLFVVQKVKEIQKSFPNMTATLLGRIEQRLSRMANGMFLWVYLVTVMLKGQATELELEEALEKLPEGLQAVYGRILDRISSLSEPKRTRAYKVLSWSCAASRAVKVQEVADGITLRPGHATILNKKTRIIDTQKDVLDICAPLIELSTGGYLEIVHASAREFLLHPQSGPFVKIAQVHFDIGYACLLSLKSSFVVLPRFSPNTTLQDIEVRMLQGFFGLHAYAHAYWAHHVNEYFRNIESFGGSVPSGCNTNIIVGLLESFSRVRKGYPGPSGADSPPCSPSLTTVPIQLSQLPHISSFIKDWTNFRSRTSETEPTTDTIEVQLQNQLHQDPTSLSLIAQKIRSIRESLIRMDPANLPDHIDKEDFASFRKELGAEIFECRYGSCNHFSGTLQQRLEHEKSHNPSFPCLHCDFSGRGFRSRRDLERHVRQYHHVDGDASIPDSLACIFERGQSTFNTHKTLQYGSLSSREPGRWNEKGRKVLKSTFRQVYKALALHEPALAKKGGFNISSDSRGELASQTNPSPIFAEIGRKIDTGEYQTLKDFKTDVNNLISQDPANDLEKIQNMFDKALGNAVDAHPGLACLPTQDPLERNIENLLSTELGRSGNSDVALVWEGRHSRTSSQTQLGCRPAFWSKLEESELPGLLAKYGGNFAQIADFLKTKTAEDVEERFQWLVNSGRQDLAELVSYAESRLSEEQEKDNTMLLDTSEHELSTATMIHEATVDDESLEEKCSREHSASPAHIFPDSADAVSYFPLPETTSAHPPQKQLGTSKASRKALLDQGPEDDNRPKKYIRRAPQPAYCHQCKSGPRKLRDEHTLMKHIARIHSPVRKVWLCIDVSIDKNMLANCQSCRSGVRYGAKHNAAIHLRNKHFGPNASMETLMRWMEEVEEPNPNHSGSQVDPDTPAAKAQKLPGIVSFWTAPAEDQSSEASEEAVSREIPLLEVSFDDILQGYSGRTTPDGTPTPRPNQERVTHSSIPHLAHQGLVRIDHIDQLPNLSGPRKAVTRDQVVAYYHTLSESSVKSKKYEEALTNLKGLSQRLLKDLRDWRRDLTSAPEIRPSF